MKVCKHSGAVSNTRQISWQKVKQRISTSLVEPSVCKALKSCTGFWDVFVDLRKKSSMTSVFSTFKRHAKFTLTHAMYAFLNAWILLNSFWIHLSFAPYLMFYSLRISQWHSNFRNFNRTILFFRHLSFRQNLFHDSSSLNKLSTPFTLSLWRIFHIREKSKQSNNSDCKQHLHIVSTSFDLK